VTGNISEGVGGIIDEIDEWVRSFQFQPVELDLDLDLSWVLAEKSRKIHIGGGLDQNRPNSTFGTFGTLTGDSRGDK